MLKWYGHLKKSQPDFLSHPETLKPPSLSKQRWVAQRESLALSYTKSKTDKSEVTYLLIVWGRSYV